MENSRKRKFEEAHVKDSMMNKEHEEILQHEYVNISDNVIIERFLDTFKSCTSYHNQIKQCLQTDKTLVKFVRQYALLLARYYSVKANLQFYVNYNQMTQNLLHWLSTMSNTLIERTNINKHIFHIQLHIKQEFKRHTEQLRIIHEKLLTQQPMAISSTVDIPLIISCIVLFVRLDHQQLFKSTFSNKRQLLMLVAKDIQLVFEFFHMQPSTRQVI